MQIRSLPHLCIEPDWSRRTDLLDVQRLSLVEYCQVSRQPRLADELLHLMQGSLLQRKTSRRRGRRSIEPHCRGEIPCPFLTCDVAEPLQCLHQYVSSAFRNAQAPAEFGDIPASLRISEEFQNLESPLHRTGMDFVLHRSPLASWAVEFI